MHRELSRRAFLQAGAMGVAAGLAASLAPSGPAAQPTAGADLIVFNADFRRAKTINIFGSSREAHGYWKTTGRFCNQGIAWRGWSRAASRRIELWQRLSKCT